jgi:hypothetical protein
MSPLVHDFDFFDLFCVSLPANSSPRAANSGPSRESGDAGGKGRSEGSDMLERRTCVGFFVSHQPKLLLLGDFTSDVALKGGQSEAGVETADLGLSASLDCTWSSCLSLVMESKILPELCGRAFVL